MSLQAIHVCILLLGFSIVTFCITLAKEKNKYYIPAASFLLAQIIFIFFYTDTLLDAFSVVILTGISGLLLCIPCIKFKENKKYLLLLIINHLLAAILLSAVRKQVLIFSPSYFTSGIFLFAYIYIIAKNDELLQSLLVSVLCIVISMGFHIDYTLPFTFNIWPNEQVIINSHSKPMIIANRYFKENYPNENILTTENIHEDGQIYILITSNKKIDGYYFIYKDNKVKPFDNSM